MTNRVVLAPFASPATRLLTLAALVLLAALAQTRGALAQQPWSTPDASGNINSTNTGNIGVGTSAPVAAVHIAKGDANGTAAFFQKNTTSGGVAFGTYNNRGTVTGANAGMTASADLLINPYGGNVGVGTLSPINKLHVFGGNIFHQFSTTAGQEWGFYTAINNNHFTSNFYFDGQWKMITPGKGALLATAPFSDVAFSVGADNTSRAANAAATVNTLFQVKMDGSVGIGTSSPSYLLDVVSGSQWAARFKKTDTTHGGILIDTAAGYNPNVALSSGGTIKWYMNSNVSAGDALQFWESTGANPRLTVTQAGNVGIGTAGPAYKLDVAGSVNASGLCFAGDCKTAWSQVGGASQWTTSSSNIYYSTGSVGIGTAGPDQRLGVQGMVGLYPQAWVQPTARGLFMGHFGTGAGIYAFNYPASTGDPIQMTGSSLDFGIYPSGGGGSRTQSMMIANNGNVGVGTASPGSPLDVEGVDSNGGIATFLNPGQSSGSTVFLGFGKAAAVDQRGNLRYTYNSTASQQSIGLAFAGHADVMTLLQSGNVGVGTTSPSTTLQVNSAGAAYTSAGQLLITDSANTNRHLRFGYDTSLEAGWIQASKIGTSFEPLLLNPNGGNVGIGITGPAYKLDVAGSVNASGLCFAGDCKTAWSQVGGASQWTTSSSNIYYSTGNVGVGTTNPAQKLHVSGGADTALLIGDRGLSGSVGLQFLGSGYKHAGVRFDGDNLIVENASNTVTPSTWYSGQPMNFIVRNGNVGIGTTSPQKALDVVGDVNATGTITGGNIQAKYQDVAEWVSAARPLSTGTVVVLDAEAANRVTASSQPYDTKVAGVVSASPGIVLGEAAADKVKVATTGRVRVKADATMGAIHIGDLLVTSGVAGVAMKSVPVDLGGTPIHRPGTIIGKALEPLEKGTGEILVLLSLQ